MTYRELFIVSFMVAQMIYIWVLFFKLRKAQRFVKEHTLPAKE